MILLTRLGGPEFALNQDLIERADCTPDTVITLVDGTKYVVSESLAELVTLVREFRASVILEAQQVERPEPHRPTRVSAVSRPPAPAASSESARSPVVQLHRRDH